MKHPSLCAPKPKPLQIWLRKRSSISVQGHTTLTTLTTLATLTA